jgi:hypothetical protein
MTHKAFEALVEEQFEEMRSMGYAKGIEYSNNEADRLANFKEVGIEAGVDAQVVCYLYLMKHMRAIASYVKHGKGFSNEPIEGRIRDAQLYLALLNALIVDQRPQGEPVCTH